MRDRREPLEPERRDDLRVEIARRQLVAVVEVDRAVQLEHDVAAFPVWQQVDADEVGADRSRGGGRDGSGS